MENTKLRKLVKLIYNKKQKNIINLTQPPLMNTVLITKQADIQNTNNNMGFTNVTRTSASNIEMQQSINKPIENEDLIILETVKVIFVS